MVGFAVGVMAEDMSSLRVLFVGQKKPAFFFLPSEYPNIPLPIVVSYNMIWVVVSTIFYFHPYLGKIPIFTNIFQRG